VSSLFDHGISMVTPLSPCAVFGRSAGPEGPFGIPSLIFFQPEYVAISLLFPSG